MTCVSAARPAPHSCGQTIQQSTDIVGTRGPIQAREHLLPPAMERVMVPSRMDRKSCSTGPGAF